MSSGPGVRNSGSHQQGSGSNQHSVSKWTSHGKGSKSQPANGSSKYRSSQENSATRLRNNIEIERAKMSERMVHCPMIFVLLTGILLPFIIFSIVAWYVLSTNSGSSLYKVEKASEASLDDLFTSQLDSVVDAEIEAFREIYEGAVKIAEAGALLEYSVGQYPYAKQQKLTAFWTQTISESYHFTMCYFVYKCHGHVVGTGYDPETGDYIAYYTDVHIFDGWNESSMETWISEDGVVYEEGCSDLDLFGDDSEERTHTKRFTERTYWSEILNPSFYDHDTTTFEDLRKRQWYLDGHLNVDECHWTLPYHELKEEDLSKYVSTLSMKTYDMAGHEHGSVAIDISLQRVIDFIAELSSNFQDTYSVVLTNEKRVMASTHKNNVHVFTVNGVETTELYEFYEYSEQIMRDFDVEVYYQLAEYLDEHPDKFTEMVQGKFDIGKEDALATPDHFKFLNKDGDPIVVSSLHMIDHCGLDAILIIMAEEKKILETVIAEYYSARADLDADTLANLLTVGGIAIVTVLAIVFVSRIVTVPLKVMGEDIKMVQELDFNGKFNKIKPFVSELASISRDYDGLKQCMERFKCFVPPQLISELVSGSSTITKRRVEAQYISTLVCDVANFTKASHKADQEIVLGFANAFLGGCADLIVKHQGTVIDFFGDQIFAIFNAPTQDPDYLSKTMKATMDIIELFDQIKLDYQKKEAIFSVVDIRIGLHCGSSLVGTIGSRNRIKYCAIGENVNLGARLESLNKRYNSRITCSSDFLFAVPRDIKKHYAFRPMEFIRVRRREAPVLIYELAGLKKNLSEKTVKEFEDHQEMFQRVRARQISPEELDAYIKKIGGNAKFLRSSSMLSDSNI